MRTINNGGPAFPSAGDGNETWAHEGMTLRDYFAAKAMQANRSRDSIYSSWDDLASDAYEIADAMLRAKEEK